MESQVHKGIERYELGEQLAAGGMAEVYCAVAYGLHGFQKRLAIKKILPALAVSPAFENRFIDEAKIAAQLTHANIVQVVDFGKFESTLFIAMEYVDGLDLATVLAGLRQRDSYLPLPAALQIAIDMLKGLEFAHARHVLHRDISPSNILLSRAGESKIADFGIAEALPLHDGNTQSADSDADKALDGQLIMGKWRYMSPEQAEGRTLSLRSDIFSAAIVIFEMLTGKALFAGDSVAAIRDAIATSPVPAPSSIRREIPASIDALLESALRRDVASRRATITSLIRELTEISYANGIVLSSAAVAEVVATLAPQATNALPYNDRVNPDIDRAIREQLLDTPAPHTRQTQRKSQSTTSPDNNAANDQGRSPDPVDAYARTPLPDDIADDANDRPADTESPRQETVVKVGTDARGLTLWKTIPASPNAMRDSQDSGVALPNQRIDQPEVQTKPPPLGRKAAVAALLLAGVAIAGFWTSQSTESPQTYPIAATESAAETPRQPERSAAQPEARSARLRVTWRPQGVEATLLLDGKAIERPSSEGLPVSPGQHTLEIMATDYQPIRQSFVIQADATHPIDVALTPKPAVINIASTPTGAQVFIDGKRQGVTPLDALATDPDASTLRLVHTGYLPHSESLALKPGQVKTVAHTFVKPVRYGTIEVSVRNPAGRASWAEIYKGQRHLGDAPLKHLRLPVGRHTLTLKNRAYGKVSLVVQVPISGTPAFVGKF